jgi:hypothetical protein
MVCAALLAAHLLSSALPSVVEAASYTRVFLNGRLVPVRFNDGDSFRIFAGEYDNRQCRLGGFNTLESFGPVHQWGGFHPYELFVNAKQATNHGKHGTWHCRTEGELDVYGRVLLDCPDLAVSQIRNGFAHAMNVNDTPSRFAYLRAQHEAIRERRGMWAHGVPAFVLTSLHSNDEDPERTRPSYNRLVSTRDGHSEKWEHQDVYGECEWVCYQEVVADEQKARDFARLLRQDPEVAPMLAPLPNILLVEIVTRWVRRSEIPAWLTEEEEKAETEARLEIEIDPRLGELLRSRLNSAMNQGVLGSREVRQGACALYAAFERRYGRDRAGCLRGRGTTPRRH